MAPEAGETEAAGQFPAQILERLGEATVAWDRSDPQPYIALWSRCEPVSLFGALGPCKTTWPEVEATFWRMASRFSDPEITTDLDVVSVGSDLAYTVGSEQGQVAIDGIRRPVKIRATHIYRREQCQWKLVHRHGDFAPVEDRPSSRTAPQD